MTSTRTNQLAQSPTPDAMPASEEPASTWHASGLGARSSDRSQGPGDRSHDMTADDLQERHPGTYQQALDVVDEAHMNEDATPAEVLDDLVPMLTDDKLKKPARRAPTS